MGKAAGFLLAFWLVLGGAVPGMAEEIDLNRSIDLTITAQVGEEALAGAEFALYRVACTDCQCGLTPESCFAPYISGDLNEMNQEQWKALADGLEKAVNRGDFPPEHQGQTGEDGRVRFTVEPGLYLVVGKPHIQGGKVYSQKPMLQMLPHREPGQPWDYQVEIYAKPGRLVEAEKATVVKIWDDENDAWEKRPGKLTVYIENELGQRLEAQLPQNGRWAYTFENLEPGHSWTAGEEEVEGYHLVGVETEQRGEELRFTLTNRCREEKPKPQKLPQTGQLWWPIPILLTAGLALVAVGLGRRREEP